MSLLPAEAAEVAAVVQGYRTILPLGPNEVVRFMTSLFAATSARPRRPLREKMEVRSISNEASPHTRIRALRNVCHGGTCGSESSYVSDG